MDPCFWSSRHERTPARRSAPLEALTAHAATTPRSAARADRRSSLRHEAVNYRPADDWRVAIIAWCVAPIVGTPNERVGAIVYSADRLTECGRGLAGRP